MEKEQAEYEEWHNSVNSEGFIENMTHVCYTCGKTNPSQKHMSETCPMLTTDTGECIEREGHRPIKRPYHLIPCLTCHKTHMKLSKRYEMDDEGTVQNIEQLSCSHCGNVEEHRQKD